MRWGPVREGIRRSALRGLVGADRILDRIRAVRGRDPARLIIQPYRSYGTRECLHVRGRVLRNRGIVRATRRDSRWRNLAQTWKRVFSDEAPGARVAAVYRGRRVEGASDAEGYFHLTVEGPGSGRIHLWEEVEVSLAGGAGAAVLVPVLVPGEHARFGIISDIDDTVIRTEATSLVRMLRALLLENAHVRLPFEGVAAFYRALHAGANPIFYVSSGPWNLYDLLVHVFEIRGIPAGPLFLQDWGIEEEQLLVRDHAAHKSEQIDAIVSTYPSLPFLLIGDSGQRDPEIYAAVARRYAGRIRAIYIRDVGGGARAAEVRALAAALGGESGVPMLLVADTRAAAEHAAANGWIGADDVPEVHAAAVADEIPGPTL